MNVEYLFSLLYDWRGVLFTAGHALSATVACAHVLLRKKEPRAAQVWLIICIFVPYLGPFGYFLLGINRIETRARKLREPSEEVLAGTEPERAYQGRFSAVGDSVMGRPAQRGNHVRALVNGEAAYPAMLGAIEQARQEVLLCSYIFSNDHIGKRFVAALAAAEQRGVTVRVLVDAIGEWYSFPRIKREMARAKLTYRRFLPPRWFPLSAT